MRIKGLFVSAGLSFLTASAGAQAAEVTYQGLFPGNDLPMSANSPPDQMSAHFEFKDGEAKTPDPDRIGGPGSLFSIIPCRMILKEKPFKTAADMAEIFSMNSGELEGSGVSGLTAAILPLVERAKRECMPNMS